MSEKFKLIIKVLLSVAKAYVKETENQVDDLCVETLEALIKGFLDDSK